MGNQGAGGNYHQGARGGGGDEGRRRRFNPVETEGSTKRIANDKQRESCKLASNETFREMFHPKFTNGLKGPTYKSGRGFCLRFHTCGHCWKDCKYITGNADIDDDEANTLCVFLDGTRQKRKEIDEGRGERDGGETRDRRERTPAVKKELAKGETK